MMVRTLSQLLKAELVGYHRNFRIASANVRTDSGRAGVIGSPPRHEDSYTVCRGRGTYRPPFIVKVMKVIHGSPGTWSGRIRAANLAYFYGCPLYLRIVPPVPTETEPIRDRGFRTPEPAPRQDPSHSGLPRGGPHWLVPVSVLGGVTLYDAYYWDAHGGSAPAAVAPPGRMG
jgi:hypothetical protein